MPEKESNFNDNFNESEDLVKFEKINSSEFFSDIIETDETENTENLIENDNQETQEVKKKQ
jgi:hypothetical protein